MEPLGQGSKGLSYKGHQKMYLDSLQCRSLQLVLITSDKYNLQVHTIIVHGVFKSQKKDPLATT